MRQLQETIANALVAIADRIAGDHLPAVTGSDNGKALLVSGGKWEKGALPSQLPAVTSADSGKILTVNSSGEWVAASPSA
jgi:hypothetical protein